MDKREQAPVALALEASCRTERVGDHDEVVIDAWVVNRSKKGICIRRMWSPIGFLSFVVTDSAGRNIVGRVLHVEVPRSDDRRDFITLTPGEIHGGRVRLVPLSHDRQRYYSLVTMLGVEKARFPLETPGRYSVSVIYGNGDDGHLAGLQAWHGGGPHELHSPKCWFELER